MGVNNQGYGRVYGTPVELDGKTNDSGDRKEETETKETDVCCSILSLRASVSANYLLLYYSDTIVTYSGSSISSHHQFSVHGGRTVISVDWFGDGRKSGGYRWGFDFLDYT